jgi:RimJ/RimL family protein N-acetyltransferase
MTAFDATATASPDTRFAVTHGGWRLSEEFDHRHAWLRVAHGNQQACWQLEAHSGGWLARLREGHAAPAMTARDAGLETALRQWLQALFARDTGYRYLRVDDALRALCPTVFGEPVVKRAGFYQQPPLWYRGDNLGRHEQVWTTSDSGVRHPRRRPLPTGTVYERYCADIDQVFSFRRASPEQDVERLTDWMNQPRVARFWEKAVPRDEIAAYLDRVLGMKHLQPVVGCFDGQPVGYFEFYWAAEDPVGAYYEADPYDRGVHMLIGDANYLGRRLGRAWTLSLSHFVFLDDPRTRRLIGEPRADNQALLKYVERTPGWTKIKEFDFPHKRAALIVCDRDDFFDRVVFP